MPITEVIALAKQHARSAVDNMYLADAVQLNEAGHFEQAQFMALRSLFNSIGPSHEDYQRANSESDQGPIF
jgi:hypothetical protein